LISAKNGPVYDACWSPKSTEFCVVYGCILIKIVENELYKKTHFSPVTLTLKA